MYVAVYVGYVRGMSSAGTTTNGAETGEETAPEEGQRHEPERALAYNPSTSQRLYRETGSRSRSSGGDTTGLRPDVEEIRYGASVGILASQLLRHCATLTLSVNTARDGRHVS